jgi:hypothetical protein
MFDRVWQRDKPATSDLIKYTEGSSDRESLSARYLRCQLVHQINRTDGCRAAANAEAAL